MEMDDVKKRAFVACPFDMLMDKGYLDLAIEMGINLEIGLNGDILSRFPFYSFYQVSERFKQAGLRCSVHAPFIDISLGAFDPVIRQVCVNRIGDAIDIAVLFRATNVVIHTGFVPLVFGEIRQVWLENFIASMKTVVQHATDAGISLMIENVFEKGPALHQEIFSCFDEISNLGFCLDIGHVMAFSQTSLSEWLDAVGLRTGHLHLHDNHGGTDEHLAIGEGKGDFDYLFAWLADRDIHPVITIEAHDREKVLPSFEALARLLDRYGI